MEWFELMGYALGLITGLILGILGGGGSVLIMPILVYLFRINPAEATAHSLLVVGCGAAVGTLASIKTKQVNWKTGGLFAIPSMVAVYAVQRWGLAIIPDTWSLGGLRLSKDMLIMGIYALLMIAAAYSMLKRRKEMTKMDLGKNQWWIISIEGFVIGGLTGLVGAGGGFLIVPALVILVGMPMEMAVCTSLFIISIKSIVGFFGAIGSGAAINWMLILPFLTLLVGGCYIGTQLRGLIEASILKRMFGWFILIMGLIILLFELL